MPTNSAYATYNTYTPLSSSQSASGRSTAPNLTLDQTLSSANNYSTLMRNRAYSRLDDSPLNKSNPEFDMGAAGRVLGSIADRGGDQRIVRGYIRRTTLDTADPTSGYRLYFMYNPSQIQRQYVSYLDQMALDPFNTVFGSQNLVAPPGILDFSFDMFFDRQTENANGSMPRGALEDFDYFDLVVRGVVPDAQTGGLPDNGVMMINPRNITVVFSHNLSVQGRPNQASVTYLKFDHRMRPTQIQIRINMKAFYIGPVRQDFTFAQSKEVGTFSATVPYENMGPIATTVEQVLQSFSSNIDTAVQSTVKNIQNFIGNSNSDVRLAALAAAEALGENTVAYTKQRTDLLNPDLGLDCSGLVYYAYAKVGALGAIGQANNQCWTGSLWDAAVSMGTMVVSGDGFNDAFFSNGLQRGDLILSHNQHVAFVSAVRPETKEIQTYESARPGLGPGHLWFPYSQIYGSPNNHTGCIRPSAGGSNTVLNIPDTGYLL